MIKCNILYKLTAPLSHIGETNSISTTFQTVRTASGRVPVVTGNSIRGTLRDKGAEYLLDALDMKVNKTIFNVLFSGGNITGGMKNDVARAKTIREKLPLVSLFGGGLGSQIMAGKMDVGFAYLCCSEMPDICRAAGIDDAPSWKKLIDEIEMTRMDDTKEDKLALKYITDNSEDAKGTASTQMRYKVQYLVPGAQLFQEITFAENITDAESGAFITALEKWFEKPIMGGMGAKGFGKFRARAMFVDETGVELARITTLQSHNAGEEWYGTKEAAYNMTLDAAPRYLELLEKEKLSEKEAG